MSIDDFLKQIEADELEDRLVEQTHATPIEYARSRGMAPQRVYYMLRNHRLESERCACGRRVVNIEAADELFGYKAEPEEMDEDENDLDHQSGTDYDGVDA